MDSNSKQTFKEAMASNRHEVLPAIRAIRATLNGRKTQVSVAMSASLLVAAEAAMDGGMAVEDFIMVAQWAFDSQVSASAIMQQNDPTLS